MPLLPHRLWCYLIGAFLALLVLMAVLLATAHHLFLSYKEAPLPPALARQENALATTLRQEVETLCAHARHGDENTRRRTTDHITQRLIAAGWQVRQHSFTIPTSPSSPHSSQQEQHWNIIATYPHAIPGGKRYIIGAHYDTCDTGDDNPGADDNASACAALLTLADMLGPARNNARQGKHHTPSLELVFYASEEPPWFGTEWMGSAQHARTCTPSDTLGMVCLESLGYYRDEAGSQPALFPGHHLLLPTTGNFIAVCGDMNARSLARRAQQYLMRGMPALRANIPFAQDTELFFSDHRNYAPRNIPAIMVTDTALLRNPNYHEASDTPDTLDYTRLARVTLNLARFLRSLTRSNSVESPQGTHLRHED